ncbi:MAG TPA: Maf family protein [Thermoanaerobaculia bacterium]
MSSPAPPRLVLASSSPRRRELLARLGVEFEARATDADERPLAGEAPADLVRRLALAKARAAARPGEAALGADTVVALGGEILGKPADDADARRMLRRLSGRAHEVWSGVAIVFGADAGAGRETVQVVRSDVRFRTLSDAEIADYVAGGEPRDKAGAYAVQGGAAGFVAALAGERSNVVGLPLAATARLLADFGFTVRAEGRALDVEPPSSAGNKTALSRRP